MRAAIQSQIAPTSGKTVKKLNDAKIDNQTAVKSGGNDEIDFKSVLMESNSETARKRELRKNGDLSTADSYDAFLEELAAQTEQKDAPKNTMDKDDFLTLFVTQLQQQDPLNPQDGTEMAAQLAQFNSLEQMMNVNATLENMVAAQENQKKLQFLNYVGKEVSINGGKIALKDDGINDVNFTSDRELGRSTMIVRDKRGEEVFRRELGVLGAGRHKISWDGMGADGRKQSAGVYSVEVKGQSSKGDPISVSMTSSVTISGVDLVKDGNNLYTDIGPINFTDVQAVGKKGFMRGGEDKEKVDANLEKDQQLKALEAMKEKKIKAKENGELTAADVNQAVEKTDTKNKSEKDEKTTEVKATDETKAAQRQAASSDPNQHLTPEQRAQAEAMAKQMGFSLTPPDTNAGAQKSGRIPISSGQYAQTESAPKQ